MILQHGFGWDSELLRVGAPSFQRAAELHGLSYVQNFERLVTDRKAHWEKIRLLRHYLNTLPDNDVILWADADTFYCKPDVSPVGVLPADKDLGWLKVKWGWWNSGFMFIRVNNTMRDFFATVFEKDVVSKSPEGLQDEARMNVELQTNQRVRIFELPCIWHTFPRGLNIHPDPIVRGWHGDPRHTVLKRMRELAATMKAPELAEKLNAAEKGGATKWL